MRRAAGQVRPESYRVGRQGRRGRWRKDVSSPAILVTRSVRLDFLLGYPGCGRPPARLYIGACNWGVRRWHGLRPRLRTDFIHLGSKVAPRFVLHLCSGSLARSGSGTPVLLSAVVSVRVGSICSIVGGWANFTALLLRAGGIDGHKRPRGFVLLPEEPSCEMAPRRERSQPVVTRMGCFLHGVPVCGGVLNFRRIE